ncbi:hypothetical protein JXD38_12310, partial [candidate division WOR-3 bacterium]|nr:hypothetical protein [candidate division WOR-3 bacterium]
MMHMLLFALLGMQLRYLSTTPDPPSPGFGMSVLYRDTFCYVPTYAGFEILNISDPDSIQIVSSQTTDGYTRHMDLDTPYLYVADSYNGLVVADVSDPANPSIVGHCPDMTYAWGVGHHAGHVYVGDYYEGLVVIDVSDPEQPVRVGSLSVDEPAWGLEVCYPYLYLAAHSFFPRIGAVYVFDITDPADPVQVASVIDSGQGFAEVAIRDSILYACSMVDGASSPNLVLYDISQPTTPVELSSYRPPGGAAVIGIALRPGDTLAFPSIFTKGMAVLNVADPTQPKELSTFRYASGQVEAIGVSGNRVYMLQADPSVGLVEVDVSDPVNPSYVTNVSFGAHFRRPVTHDNLGFFTRGGSGVDIHRLSDPLVPQKLGRAPAPTDGAAVRGELLFCSNASPGGLYVYDVSDPENPCFVSASDTFLPSTNLVVRGDYLYYVGGLRHYGYDWVVAVDISDSTMPRVAGECAYSGGNYAITLDPSRPYLYATRYMMLEVFDISNPLAPVEVAQCSLRGSAPGITVRGHLAYVADYTEGLTVVDVANPGEPHVVGWYKDPDHNEMFDVAVIRNAAVLCNGDMGVWLLDVSDLVDIRLEDKYDTPSSAERICVFQDTLVAVNDVSAVLFFGVQGLGIGEERGGGGSIGSPAGLLVTPTC